MRFLRQMREQRLHLGLVIEEAPTAVLGDMSICSSF
jgi:hypothetical protein